MTHPAEEVTLLLDAVGRGDDSAAARLVELVYAELRGLAGSYSRRASGNTLAPTALVHEAFLKLVDQTNPRWNDRAHFFAVAATAMRQILIDHARRRRADKRGGGDWQRISLGAVSSGEPADEIDIAALDDALTKLAGLDARKHRVVELRFFGGLSMEDVAKLLNVSVTTVESDWRGARAWLSKELSA